MESVVLPAATSWTSPNVQFMFLVNFFVFIHVLIPVFIHVV